MKKGLTELLFILDRSGSMAGLESDTIGGFNSMMEKQRQEPGEACVTTVLFDDQYEVVHDRLSADCVEPMTGRQYYVRGCTALLDAMGRAITHTANVVRSVQMCIRDRSGVDSSARGRAWLQEAGHWTGRQLYQ